ncbi:MAG: ATP-dependent helicase [Anaerolineales bacterium]
MTANFTPRPSQQKILQYRGGRLGIAAAPGAGKTHILSALAANIIKSGALHDEQEVLIVTLVNTAVDNFETRIKRFFDNPLEALYKYRVRTLHALAHEIVREKPASVGLDNQFKIIDERESKAALQDVVKAWLATHSLEDYLNPEMEASKRDWARREKLPGVVHSLASSFIKLAKDRLLTPEALRAQLDSYPAALPLAALGCDIYADYQRALNYRGAVDFDDLIRFALVILQSDADYLARLQERYPFILEDEAQDSSRTQQKILELISGEGGNWTRVGDPNQAIYETFTTADPELLRAFIRNHPSEDMPESGRSQPAILALANQLIDWTMNDHPQPALRSALSLPYILPTPAGDPQQNPPNDPQAVKLISKKHTPEQELEAVVKSVKKHLSEFQDAPEEEKPTIAILVPINFRGIDFIEALKKNNIEVVEMISSTSETRAAAGSLHHLLAYLADPQSAGKLSKAYEVFRRDWRKETETEKDRTELLKRAAAALKKITHVESFIAPTDVDVLSQISVSEPAELIEELQTFRETMRRWLNAAALPIDQLTLTLARDVFKQPADLALAHKLALALRQVAADRPHWRLPELAAELLLIAKNERRFIGFSEDDFGFDPEKHRGKVAVATAHKAKGLEWDRVYLTSVNNYDFPANLPGDQFISEKWFIRQKLNLEAEALAQLDALQSNDEYRVYQEGVATAEARAAYAKERLRLLYVGITRAKKDLIITWNTGRRGEATVSLALQALIDWQSQTASKL